MPRHAPELRPQRPSTHSQAPRRSTRDRGLPDAPDQALSHAAQETMGNLRVQAALGGAPGDGLALSLLSDLSAAAAGLELGGLGGGCNQTMLRRLRAHQAGAEADGVELGGDDAPLPVGARRRVEAVLGPLRGRGGGLDPVTARAIEALCFTVRADHADPPGRPGEVIADEELAAWAGLEGL